MTVLSNNFRAVFWWAVVPAIVAVGLMIFGVEEPENVKPSAQRGWPIRGADLLRMSGLYWLVVLVGVVFTLARFSEAFLVLKGQAAGLPVDLVPLVIVVMNLVYAGISTPAGALSDKIGRRKVLMAGVLALVAADLTLAFAPGIVGLFCGIGLWGAYLGFTQGLLSALVADAAPADLRGTAFGIFNLLTGTILLIASALAGALWQSYGPAATFTAGAGFAALAAVALLALREPETPPFSDSCVS